MGNEQPLLLAAEGPGANAGNKPGIARLARRCCAEFRHSAELIEEKLFASDHGPEERLILCHHRGEIVGAAATDIHVIGGLRIGGVRVLLVDPMFRRRGVGSALVNAAESHFVARGVNRIWLYCSLPNYLFPGAPADDLRIARFADKMGYGSTIHTRDIAVDLECLGAAPQPSPLVIRPVRTSSEVEGLLDFTSREAPGFLPEVQRALRRPHPIAYAAHDGDAQIGFCVASSNNVSLGAVGPAAILPSHRGGRAFRLLLHACMSDLKSAGQTIARMQWADLRAPSFYKRWFDGFVCDDFHIYIKKLPERLAQPA